MSEAITITAKQAGSKILKDLSGGLIAAAASYKEYIDAGGTTAELHREWPQLGVRLLNTLEGVAVGRIFPGLVAMMPGGIPAALENAPVSEQRRLANGGIDVVTHDGTLLRVQLSHLTAYQRRQVFAPDHVRPENEQRAWIESEKAKALREKQAEPIKPPAPFEVVRGVLVVREAHDFTAPELIRLLGLMTK